MERRYLACTAFQAAQRCARADGSATGSTTACTAAIPGGEPLRPCRRWRYPQRPRQRGGVPEEGLGGVPPPGATLVASGGGASLPLPPALGRELAPLRPDHRASRIASKERRRGPQRIAPLQPFPGRERARRNVAPG